MTDNITPTPSQYEENHFPVRGGDWLMSEWGEIAQVKAIHVDKDYSTGEQEFLVDLYFYHESGMKIGRKSDSFPMKIGDKTIRGPRTFEPCCSMEGWTRIEPPDFPIERVMMSVADKDDPTKRYLRYEYDVPRKAWGNYKKPIRVKAKLPAVPAKSNFDAELEKRVLMMTAQNLRDIARETGNDDLRQRAIALEKQADQI